MSLKLTNLRLDTIKNEFVTYYKFIFTITSFSPSFKIVVRRQRAHICATHGVRDMKRAARFIIGWQITDLPSSLDVPNQSGLTLLV